MPFGIGEVLLVALLAFVVFGPRKKGPPPNRRLRAFIVAALAVCAPSFVIMDRAGDALGLSMKARLILTAAAVASATLTLVLARTADRYLARRT